MFPVSSRAARCNEPATNLSRPLKKLIDLGFLEKDVPFGIDEKNAKKSLNPVRFHFLYLGHNLLTGLFIMLPYHKMLLCQGTKAAVAAAGISLSLIHI